jgi:tetratricopeptide (TPR) repeat protein
MGGVPIKTVSVERFILLSGALEMTKKWRHATIAAVSLTIMFDLFLTTGARSEEDMCIINGGIDQNLIIQGCTKIIQSGKVKGSDLGYAYALRARAARLKGAPDDAIADATKSIELDPTYGLPYYVRAQAYSNKGEYDQAIKDYNVSLKIRPNDEIVYQEIGHAYQGKGDYDRADENYDLALKVKPNFAWAHNDKCRIRVVFNRDLDTALKECKEALRLDPDSGFSHYNRGLVQLRLHNFPAALSDFTAAIETNPKVGGPYYGRGLAKLETGETESGNKDIADAKSIQPDVEAEFKSYGLEPKAAKPATPVAEADKAPAAPASTGRKRPKKAH